MRHKDRATKTFYAHAGARKIEIKVQRYRLSKKHWGLLNSKCRLTPIAKRKKSG